MQFRNHPDYPEFNADGKSAEKYCETDGTWERNKDSNLTWSDYNPCLPEMTFHEAMSILNVVGISLSLIFLIISLTIFIVFHSSLNCGRVKMHMNLFLAFILR